MLVRYRRSRGCVALRGTDRLVASEAADAIEARGPVIRETGGSEQASKREKERQRDRETERGREREGGRESNDAHVFEAGAQRRQRLLVGPEGQQCPGAPVGAVAHGRVDNVPAAGKHALQRILARVPAAGKTQVTQTQSDLETGTQTHTHRQAGRHTGRQAGRQTDTDRETERQRDRETERQRDRETDRQTDRQTDGERRYA